MYEARDAAFKQFIDDSINVDKLLDLDDNFEELHKYAFNAGWKARKELDFKDAMYAEEVLNKFIPKNSTYATHTVVKMD